MLKLKNKCKQLNKGAEINNEVIRSELHSIATSFFNRTQLHSIYRYVNVITITDIC